MAGPIASYVPHKACSYLQVYSKRLDLIMASRSEARMRKAFKFTDDNDSDDMPEALDEEGKMKLFSVEIFI